MVGDPVSATRGLDVSAGARGEPHGSAGPRSGVIKGTRGVHPTNQLADRTSTALSQGAGVCSVKKNEPSATSLLTLSRSMNVELRPKGNGRLPLEVTSPGGSPVRWDYKLGYGGGHDRAVTKRGRPKKGKSWRSRLVYCWETSAMMVDCGPQDMLVKEEAPLYMRF